MSRIKLQSAWRRSLPPSVRNGDTAEAAIGQGWYGGGGTTTTTGQTSTIYTGQLGLDMYDSAQPDLVWRGVVSKTIDPKAKPDKREKNLKKAVAKLLKNYPPQKK
jgi:hypothetical protein